MVTPMEKREHPVKAVDIRLGEEEIQAVAEVLRSGALREGAKCAELEKEFAVAVDAKGACAVSSGTAALHAAYSQWLEEGDEVLVPAVSFFATASMVCWAGGRPVFCDIDPSTYCLDPEDARRRVTERTRAIAPVHLFGNASDVDAILELAEERDLKVIWDAAQAHLTMWRGHDVGSLPGMTCYSFYATKNMTTGEGGLITSDNEAYLDHVRLMKRQGQAAKYQHTLLGTNYRMTDIQAALGLVQLRRLRGFTEARQRNAQCYRERLADVAGLHLPSVDDRVEHSYHQYTVTVDPEEVGRSRDEIVARLRDLNIQIGINYPVPLHRQPVFEAMATDRQDLPVAERFCETCLSLPVQPFLEREETDYVAGAVAHVMECRT